MASSRSPGNSASKARQRSRLDPLAEQKKRFEGEEIEDLPELPTVEVTPRKRGIDAARKCEKCGNENPRMVSNRNGVRAFCTCGNHWGISLMAMRPNLPVTGARGISKETLVEPDWSLANMDLDSEEHFVRSDEKDET